MQIVIIEDEIKTAKALARLINIVEKDAEIIATLQSVQSAISYFLLHKAPDIVFMDIQLSDGLCFDIFEEVKIECPIVFCTAYEEYALQGFNANGIDYILKPFTLETLKNTFKKIRLFSNHFQEGSIPSDVTQKLLPVKDKKSFLVFQRNKYQAIPTEKIAYFFIKNELPALFTFSGETYFLQQSLKDIYSLLSPQQFYRITRKYLVNFDAIKEVEHFFSRKLLVHLKVHVAESLLINKNNTTAFLEWMDQR